MTALGTLSLLRNPEQLATLRAEPELIPGAVEELLRYLSIIQSGLPRIALTDVEVGGQLVRAGEGVICSLQTANRDEERFAEPDTLDVRGTGGGTWPSASGSTSAWGSRWRGWSCRWRWRP